MPRRTSVPGRSCSNVAQHTRCPDGYLAWHEWAEKKAETHDQQQCPECDLYAIWTLKESSDA